MSVKIRLQRWGGKKKAFYQIVAINSRNCRNGEVLEKLGTYNPNVNPSLIEMKSDRVNHWKSVGAIPSETVKKLIKITEAKV